MNKERKKQDTLVGLAILGSGITGVASLIVGLVSLLDGDLIAVGVCLIAAALAFGLESVLCAWCISPGIARMGSGFWWLKTVCFSPGTL